MPDQLVSRPKVVVTRKLPSAVEDRMAELFDVELNADDTALSRAALVDAVSRADVLVPTVTDAIDADVLAAAGPQLKLIANFGAGVNHIDLAAAFARDLTVTNTPGVLTEDTADLTMALLLGVPRRLSEGVRLLRAGKWDGWAPTRLMGTRVGGKKLGIVGMGRIGQAVARRAHAFGLDLHYTKRTRLPAALEASLHATYWDDLDAMLEDVDFVSVNAPLTDETHHLFGAARLARMKRTAIIVNTARGEIIDEAALAAALKDGVIAGAGLDVYEHEPDIHPDLLGLDNVLLLPHLGSATLEARIAMGEKVLINIRTFVDGHRPPDRLLPA